MPLRPPHQIRLFEEKRSITYGIAFGIWGIVFAYALLHDQYLVRIAPEHFTVYHEHVWGLDQRHPRLLAAAWAFKASVWPGLGLGIACAAAARAGSYPRVSPAFCLKGTAAIVAATELAAASSGLYTHKTSHLLYPASLYPEKSGPLAVTQTIQLTAYATSLTLSGAFLVLIVARRHRMAAENRSRTTADTHP